jgi:hypothetical protein
MLSYASIQVLYLLIKFCPWLLYAYINTCVLGVFQMYEHEAKR